MEIMWLQAKSCLALPASFAAWNESNIRKALVNCSTAPCKSWWHQDRAAETARRRCVLSVRAAVDSVNT